MTSPETHSDVAAYALGVLDERDAARFEDHLVSCEACAAELTSLLPAAGALAGVDGDSVIRMEQSIRDGLLLDRMVKVVGHERIRSRTRRAVAVAAALTVLAVVATLSLAAGVRYGRRDTGAAPPAGRAPAATPAVTPTVTLGIGGPTPPGERFMAVDPTSGVSAEIFVYSGASGTQLTLVLTRVGGPLACRLVVVDRAGTPDTVASWQVPPAGYGTAAQPTPLFLQTTTAVARGAVARVEVQGVAPNGTVTALVGVPV